MAYGWNVLRVGDANDTERFAEAIQTFKSTHAVPTLIIVNSLIGFGAPHKQDTASAHGEALGEEEVKLAKRAYGWPEDASLPGAGRRGGAFRRRHRRAGPQAPGRLGKAVQGLSPPSTPTSPNNFTAMQNQEPPKGWDKDLPSFPPTPRASPPAPPAAR